MLAMPASVVAQVASPSPDPATVIAESEFADVLPAELGGEPWSQVEIVAGEEWLEQSTDPEEQADLEAMLEGLGASVEDVSAATASQYDDDFSEFSLVFAFRVDGVEADRLLEALLPEFAADLDEPVEESGEVAGRAVATVYDRAADVFFSRAQPIHLMASGDTVWAVSALEPLLSEAFDLIP